MDRAGYEKIKSIVGDEAIVTEPGEGEHLKYVDVMVEDSYMRPARLMELLDKGGLFKTDPDDESTDPVLEKSGQEAPRLKLPGTGRYKSYHLLTFLDKNA